jgi:hypothetical protein
LPAVSGTDVVFSKTQLGFYLPLLATVAAVVVVLLCCAHPPAKP